jgi:hypothetical protein
MNPFVNLSRRALRLRALLGLFAKIKDARQARKIMCAREVLFPACDPVASGEDCEDIVD